MIKYILIQYMLYRCLVYTSVYIYIYTHTCRRYGYLTSESVAASTQLALVKGASDSLPHTPGAGTAVAAILEGG